MPAAFGPTAPLQGLRAELAVAEPYEACVPLVGSADGVAEAEVVVDLFFGRGCTGKRRRLTKQDFHGEGHAGGWSGCTAGAAEARWDDGSSMAYQSDARTWWGSFRATPGHAVEYGDNCHAGACSPTPNPLPPPHPHPAPPPPPHPPPGARTPSGAPAAR